MTKVILCGVFYGNEYLFSRQMAEEVMKTPPSPTERESRAEVEELEGFEGMDALARTMEACELEQNCSLTLCPPSYLLVHSTSQFYDVYRSSCSTPLSVSVCQLRTAAKRV